MKAKTCFVILLFVVFNSCKNNGDNDVTPGISNIYGKWKFVQSSGGIGGFKYTAASLGYNQYLEFKTNNIQLWFKNDTLKYQNQFTLVKGKSIYTGDTLYIIKHIPETITQSVLKINRDTLVLGDEVYDGFVTIYTRQK